ncbi:hypothetical protein F4806DRAFT_507631 [Annulohypoxylon nitens]|nr:hypothetical protein F4806DRAFT_507631 [Annulohypoxylon nitens]
MEMDQLTTAPMPPPGPTTPNIVSIETFHGIMWGGFALCVIVFSGRIAIRVMCFKRMFVEDYMMLVSMCCLLAASIMGQLFLKYVYTIDTINNDFEPPPGFIDDATRGLRAYGSTMLLNYLGIWLVKFNFLLFFRRLGNHVNTYCIFWWAVFIFNLAAGAIVIGLIDFSCAMRFTEAALATCNNSKYIKKSYILTRIQSVLDAFGDILIIGFPCWILWGCKFNLRKKLALTSIFGLVALTVVVTIIRGTTFDSGYHFIPENGVKRINMTWLWFWFNIEFIVAFTIGCLGSFRALFAQKSIAAKDAAVRERQRRAALYGTSKPKRLRTRARLFTDDLLTTVMTWEDPRGTDEDVSELPHPPSGRLSVDFQRGEAWSQPSTSSKHSDSLKASTVREPDVQV